MNNLHNQIKKRRLELGFKQEGMANHIGMARQQYQRLESKGNPRLDTLELMAKGLKMELILIPNDKLRAVKDVLDNIKPNAPENIVQEPNPWDGILEDS